MAIIIALAGNPNSGKTTLFNSLTGSNQYVGNWPGVTVEKKEGRLKGHKDVTIADLPGIYSLSPYTLEEVVARNYLIQQRPDAILNIVDGTNLERNLYLTTQLVELGIPVVVAVNMMDVVQKNGDKVNKEELSKELGCPVVEISALKNTGTIESAETAIQAAQSGVPMTARHSFQPVVEHALEQIAAGLKDVPEESRRWYAIKIFERDDKIAGQVKAPDNAESIISAVEEEMDDDAESIITNERYLYISSIIDRCYKKKNKDALSTSDKIDRIVTNRWAALPIFAVVMFIVYYISVTTVGTLLTDFTNDVFVGEWCQGGASWLLERIGCADWLESLIVDGIIGGVGAVLGFVPQMLVLFIFLAFLEGCGYMARVAFVMDRIFRKFGLSGKSFIPMLIGSGCGIPGVMASRTIENERDRRMTVMTTTFIPCGAKLPIIALIAGAFFGGSGLVATSAYFIGAAAIVVTGIMLKKTRMFAGDPAPFVMELPAYHLPTVGYVARSMWERGWSFIKKAGSIILLSTILLWFLQSFSFTGGFHMIEDQLAERENSILARIGQTLGFLFIPLGWNEGGSIWESTVAAISGLIAKENVVATYGVLFNIGTEVGEDDTSLWAALAANFNYNGLVAYSYMIFNLLCAPCFAAMGAIRREMNNWRWTAFAITYQCCFAYVVSLCVYQIGSALAGNVHPVGLIAAIVCVCVIVYLLLRPYKESNKLGATVRVK